MIAKLLIANRGEIAIRVAQTARRLGVATVAVYSDVDAGAAHVAACDQTVALGGKTPIESYLRGDAIIAAALDTGAEAIHPGYGFLSEDPDFADAVTAAGLIFIGPSGEAIRKMGLKDRAKALMEDAGVPIVPGYLGADQSAKALESAADEIGVPLLIKAVAGGGGKGMRLVGDMEDFPAALRAAKEEAQASFGNDAVLLEKYITAPRHIEVQIFGDGSDAVHLFERDCSLQRRHQKVVEEAPAPGMTDAMRRAMGDAATAAARAIGYAGAGTVEFIVDGSDGLHPDRFWFMEMNTRLQVEHPVTEAITGVDLVEWQLRVASGQALPLAQSDLRINGHAVEARLYAEDPVTGFLPSTGDIGVLEFPGNARIDSAVRAGDSVSPYYDPMIAKITVHGTDRAAAFAKMGAALATTRVTGVATNRDFLQRLMGLPEFVDGDFDTGIIARHQDALTAPGLPSPEMIGMMATRVLGVAPGGQSAPFSNWTPLRYPFAITIGGQAHTGFLQPSPAGVRVETAEALADIAADDPIWALPMHPDGDAWVFFTPEAFRVAIPDPLDRHSAVDGDAAVKAPMPGIIRSVDVALGDDVAEGAPLLVLEAMKMQHVLVAATSGQVTALNANAGDQVTAGQLLVMLEPGQADDAG